MDAHVKETKIDIGWQDLKAGPNYKPDYYARLIKTAFAGWFLILES